MYREQYGRAESLGLCPLFLKGHFRPGGSRETCLLFCHLFPDFSALLLNSCHKKQENQAAIFKRFSMDAANNAFRALVNRTPLVVT
jgi:hypothetical protein